MDGELAGRGSAALAGIVLTGGASRRMGRDKAMLRYPAPDGPKTMVELVVAAVARRCAPVFVVAAPRQALPDLDATVLRDEIPGAGPLPATGQGLRAAAEAGLRRAFVCAVDMPLLTAELIDQLASDDDADVVLPFDGREHYLAGVYRTELADRVDALVAAGERSMRALVEAVGARRVAVADPVPLRNLNTLADLG